ncbi:3-oxoacyl-[acyl-carrier-protein] synthase III C-terminal domain-containing protein [Streptosporangium sp. NPDC051023]|uniref:3-oxoacyl-[acyl-carrier-protein] synthase III C-terminal domain-containing protein n=1 Tax=Streptosporangium sp. NPDC051023 TaxID=3155410 RepID=UPI00344BF523
MTTLHAVAGYLPPYRMPLDAIAERLELSSDQVRIFRRFFGFREVCYEPDGTLVELLTAAASALDALRDQRHRVRYLIHARSLPEVAPYPINPLQEVRELLGLGHAQAFTLAAHGCASGLQAVDVAGKLLASDGEPDALALILAGEKVFSRRAQMISDISIMGEGAAAVLVSPRGERDRMLSYASETHGRFASFWKSTPGSFTDYSEAYPAALAAVMTAAAEHAGLALGDMAAVLPHSVNLMSWNRLCTQIGFPAERVVLDNVAVTGHSFCADPFINYRTAVGDGRIRPGDAYLMVAAGLSGTFSAMAFRH